MTPKRKQRLAVVILLVCGVAVATALAVTAFKENMMFFFRPAEIAEGKAPLDRSIRVGGMVEKGSFQRAADSLKAEFKLTDYKHSVAVAYEGILPDLFREEQGIIAIGRLQPDGSFKAEEVLAKHDENYMPPEIADLKTAAKEKEKMPGAKE